MSLPKDPKPAKLVISLFLKEKELLYPVAQALAEQFGPVDMISAWFPFDYTTYYEPEMGAPLYRRVVVFKTLIDPGALAEIKIATNELELKYSDSGRRMVNMIRGIWFTSVSFWPREKIMRIGFTSEKVFMRI